MQPIRVNGLPEGRVSRVIFTGRRKRLVCISLGGNAGGALTNVDMIISYISIGLVLLIGVLIVGGSFGFIEPIYRIGLGLLIVAYAGVRLVMIQGKRRRSKKP
jgi:hypothetical protein